jgi:hypothetical protein
LLKIVAVRYPTVAVVFGKYGGEVMLRPGNTGEHHTVVRLTTNV